MRQVASTIDADCYRRLHLLHRTPLVSNKGGGILQQGIHSLNDKVTNKGWLLVVRFEHLLSYSSSLSEKPVEAFKLR